MHNQLTKTLASDQKYRTVNHYYTHPTTKQRNHQSQRLSRQNPEWNTQRKSQNPPKNPIPSNSPTDKPRQPEQLSWSWWPNWRQRKTNGDPIEIRRRVRENCEGWEERGQGRVEKEIERLLLVFLAMVGNTYGGHESKRTIMLLKRERVPEWQGRWLIES